MHIGCVASIRADSVCVFFKGHKPGERPEDILWEECIFLINADCEEKAKERAKDTALANETSYETSDGKTLHWKFECIERTFLIDNYINVDLDSTSGITLFSRFLRNSEVESLLTPFDD